MLAEMRPSELGQWLALYCIDPWDEARADLRTGIVAAAVRNGRAQKRSGDPFVPADFMPLLERRQEGNLADAPDVGEAQVRSVFGGLIKKKGVA